MPRLSRGTRYREGRREGRGQHGDSDTAAMKETAVGENVDRGQWKALQIQSGSLPAELPLPQTCPGLLVVGPWVPGHGAGRVPNGLCPQAARWV